LEHIKALVFSKREANFSLLLQASGRPRDDLRGTRM
jgi:hypothetical protein